MNIDAGMDNENRFKTLTALKNKSCKHFKKKYYFKDRSENILQKRSSCCFI